MRHRISVALNSQALKNLSANLNFSASTGSAYNITTGRDDNGDLLFSDRPIGLRRNAGRGAGQWNINASLNYNITFGRPRGDNSAATATQMGAIMAGIEGRRMVLMAGGPGGAAQAGRYRMSIFLRIPNLTNRANPFGYIGAQTSPGFGRPNSHQGIRQINLGMNFGF